MLTCSERATWFEDFVLVDGITRAGKFVLATVVAAFEGLEYFQYPFLLETLLYLHRLNKIDLDVCRTLLQADVQIRAYDMMIGRGLNTRIHDLSCIHRAATAGEFLERATQPDRDGLLDRFTAAKRLPLFINHEGLSNARALFGIFPGVRVINIVRDPVAVIDSWFRRGWGRRIGADPTVGWVTFDSAGGPVPWWAVDWADEYHQLSEMDRCVRSVAALTDAARQEYERLPRQRREQVLFVRFETLVTDPDAVVGRVGAFLGRSPSAGMAEILARERLPRPAPDREEALATIRRAMSPDLEPVLDALLREYADYWCAR